MLLSELGTSVTLSSGVAVPIETIIGGNSVLSWDKRASSRRKGSESGGAVVSIVTDAWCNGRKPCVQLTLEDGRKLVITPDHKVRTTTGWVRADELKLGTSQVLVAPDVPLDTPSEACSGCEQSFAFKVGHLQFCMRNRRSRARTLAFMRLLGFITGQSLSHFCINDRYCRCCTCGESISTVSRIDAECVANDIELLVRRRSDIVTRDYGSNVIRFHVSLPPLLVQHFHAMGIMCRKSNSMQYPNVQEFLTQSSCPKSVIREYLGGLFGGAGEGPRLYEDGFSSVCLSVAVDKGDLKHFLKHGVRSLLRCFDIDAKVLQAVNVGGCERNRKMVLSLECSHLDFAQKIGFRYSGVNATRLGAAAAWNRRQSFITRHFACGSDINTTPASQVATDSCTVPHDFLVKIGAIDWFKDCYDSNGDSHEDSSALPLLELTVVDRHPYLTATGDDPIVYDLSVHRTTSFVANGIIVHNCHQVCVYAVMKLLLLSTCSLTLFNDAFDGHCRAIATTISCSQRFACTILIQTVTIIMCTRSASSNPRFVGEGV